ncbi:MAG: DUF1064 domain-containing protein [Planctomycetota bacterium]
MKPLTPNEFQEVADRLGIQGVPAKAGAANSARRMNKTEERFRRERVEPRVLAGELAAVMFEAVKFRLADRTWYTPDFVLIRTDGLIEVVEVKGGWWQEDARVKWKVFAEQHPWFAHRVEQWDKEQWKVETYA